MAHLQRLIDPQKTQRLVRVRFNGTGQEALRSEDEADLLEREGIAHRVMTTAMRSTENEQRR